ncbi:glycerophosphodiester phosphodiesterase family protein [Enterococcus sp. BWB1-3]|uniref:glycerophosphodiester phosphodiesterase family protein n=1 Tax=Enterococcus sp. BWB1-3 TaxID=2787713 RepID=UPI001923427F|nr:glycerophosphodiester phosphodiesterase family protein [Enterococcus sp. BWB1-3]MBL1229287.1 glycerophosphodiester phosphodiesterase family protein [Enterococcus sp. BWB1-3]
MVDQLVRRLRKKRKEGCPIIAAHRGTEGGNIIQNTMRSYKNAIVQHAEIIETDIAKSKDDVFYMFHTGQEKKVFGFDCSIESMTSAEITRLKLRNSTFDLVDQRITNFKDLVNELSEETIITVDRSWFYWEQFLNYIVKNNFSNKVIVKAPATSEILELLSKIAPTLNFMAIIKTQNCIDILNKYKKRVNLLGLEIIFDDITSPLASKQFIKQCHNENLFLWVNALNVNDDTILAGGLDDDTSVLVSKDKGWGKLIDRNFDIIQTDWPLLLSDYIKERGEINEKDI